MRYLALLALLGCHARMDREDKCHDVVEHMRKVSAMPMRDGDVGMFMGACKMWMQSTVDCMAAAANDDDIAKCRAMEK
jgi:hypothetical protein